jgi:uncharacterized membrane protein YGL010W
MVSIHCVFLYFYRKDSARNIYYLYLSSTFIFGIIGIFTASYFALVIIFRLFGGLTNLDMLEQLASYGAYHSHPINQLIHVIFVPVILFTLMVFVSYIPSAVTLSPEGILRKYASVVIGNDGADVNWSFLVFVTYALYYVTLDVKVGSSAALYLYLLYRAVEPFKQWITTNPIAVGMDRPWAVALVLHIFAWYMQIHPGHAIFEKRKPALLDSFAQSIMMAPLFVWYEVLFFLGYDKEFKKMLDKKVEENKAMAGLGKDNKEAKEA